MTKALLLSLVFLALGNTVYAHCQIPCGIYGDKRVFDQLDENIKTIEKAMKSINTLSKEPGKNINQLVRWVNNKEVHANEIMDTILDYFLAQRVKFPSEDPQKIVVYQKKLVLLHQIIVYSMKSKQTTNLKYVEKLRTSLGQFRDIYFGQEKLKQLQKHH